MLNKYIHKHMGLVPLQVPEAVQVSIIQYMHKHMGSAPLQGTEAVQVSIC